MNFEKEKKEILGSDKTSQVNEKPRFIGTESGLVMNTPKAQEYVNNLYDRADKMNWEEIKKIKKLSRGENDLEFTLDAIREDIANMNSSPDRNEEEIQTLRAAELFLSIEQEKRKNNKNRETNFGNEREREGPEGEELFQYQIENNSHSNAKNLQIGIGLFIDSIDKGIGSLTLNDLKRELDQIIYENSDGLEYKEGEENKLDESNKKILEPVLNFREELSDWNTFSQERIYSLRKELLGYLKGVFGIEIYTPNEGEDYKNKGKSSKIEETKNEFLNDKIKKVLRPGLKISDKLFDYYQKWFSEKQQEIREKQISLKSSISGEEFDGILNENNEWQRKYRIGKVVRQAELEVYKYKA